MGQVGSEGQKRMTAIQIPTSGTQGDTVHDNVSDAFEWLRNIIL